MSVIERSITVAVCTECGGIAGASAHGHAPPVEWHWESVEYVRADQLAGAVEAMELARVELDTALGFIDAAATFKGRRSVRLCIVRARHFIGGQ